MASNTRKIGSELLHYRASMGWEQIKVTVSENCLLDRRTKRPGLARSLHEDIARMNANLFQTIALETLQIKILRNAVHGPSDGLSWRPEPSGDHVCRSVQLNHSASFTGGTSQLVLPFRSDDAA
jgi:hypothetical protein